MNAPSYAGSSGSGGSGGNGTPQGSNGSSGTHAIDGSGPDLFGKFTSLSHNFIGLRDGSAGFTNNARSDIVGSGSPLDAMISPLADNHGFVTTCALLADSPALDAGDDTLLISNIVVDARSYPRQSGVHVDIGAYEQQYLSFPILCKMNVTANGAQFTFTNAPGMTFTVFRTIDLALPSTNWDLLGQMTEFSLGFYEWTDASYRDYEARFFRASSP